MSSKDAGAMGKENDEKSALVPRLRFRNFRHECAWAQRCLGEIAQFTSGGTPSKDEPSYWNGSIPWISASSMYETRIADSELKVTTSAIGNGTRIAPKGSLLVLVRGSMLFNRVPICVAAVDVAFNQDVKALSIHGHTNTNFLLYQLIATSGRIPVNETGIGAGKIETEVLAGLPIYLPSPAEQQKIADCLSSLGELITAETQKLNSLKTHKKSLMQQLFPREGETVPRLRFPEFLEAGEWEACSLGDVIEEYREKSSSQDQYEVLTSARNGLVRQRDYYDNDRITERDNVGFNVIPPKYLTYRSRSDDRRFYFNENNLGITGIISTYYPVFRIDGGSNKFFIELLSHHAELVGKHSVGTSQTVLSLNELRRIKLPIPKEPEQQSIAECLSSLDDLITAQSRQIDALKTHKKGLMQQLFPVLDEAQA